MLRAHRILPPRVKFTAASFYLDLAQATVDIQFHAGNVGRVAGSQECHDSRYFFRLTEALHGDIFYDLFRKLIDRCLRQTGATDDRGDDRAWGYRVHADVTPNKFRGQ